MPKTDLEEAPVVGMADIARLIQDMSGKVDSIGDRVGELENSKKLGILDNIRPMAPPEDLGAARRAAFAAANRDGDVGSRQVPVDVRGQRLPQGTVLPRFFATYPIRVRRDAKREGFPKEGDLFPDKYDTDNRGHQTIRNVWKVWNAVFPGEPETFPRDVVWADILDAAKCSGIGVVKFAAFLSKLGIWKYKVYVRGLTRTVGDGFYETELEAA